MNEEQNYRSNERNAFLEFLRKLWSAKITFGISFIVSLVAVSVALGVFVNNSRAVYQSEVVYAFPGAESGKFADGTTYNYRNNISYDNLLEAKDTDESLSSIDVLGMSAAGAISVSLVEETSSDGKSTITTPAHLLYQVKQSYFQSASQARTFMDALAEIQPKNALNIELARKYNTSLELSKSAVSYDSQLNYLKTQYGLIRDGYNTLLTAYGQSLTYITSDGTETLVSEEYTSFASYFTLHPISSMQKVLENGGFVKDGDTAAEIETKARIVEIERLLAQNNAEIDALTTKYEEIYKGGSTTGASPFAERIQQLITENTVLTKEKEYLDKKLALISSGLTEEEKKQKEELDSLLASSTTALEGFVGTYTTVRKSVANKTILTTYVNSSHIQSGGVFAWYICVAAGVVAGLVVATAIAYFKGVNNFEKKNKEQEN